MPEIGYWKYVRFTDDEPLYFGTDDDVTIVFDSADDRLEFRMKKDIRFEDDAGAEILTLDKTNRHVEIPVQLNVAALEEYAAGAGISVKATMTFASGSNLNLNGNLLLNAMLGTNLKTKGYDILQGVVDSSGVRLSGGSTEGTGRGGVVMVSGITRTGMQGQVFLSTGKVTNTNAKIRMLTWTTGLVQTDRLIVNYGDDPDIDILNAKLDFHDQVPVTGKVAQDEYIEIRVGGVTRFLRLYT